MTRQDDLRRDTHRGCSFRNVGEHHRVGSHAGVVSDRDRPDDLGARPDVDVSAKPDPLGQGHLLENETVRPDPRVGVNDDPVRVKEQEAIPEMAVQGNVCPGHHAPESVLEHGGVSNAGGEKARALTARLIASQAPQETARRIPESPRLLSAQIWNRS
jgi:hypothetical protein